MAKPLPSQIVMSAGTKDPFVSQGDVTHDDDIPVQRMRKCMLRTGRYTHPTEGWTLDITPKRLDRYVAMFSRMKDNGEDVDVVRDHSFFANDHLGFLVAMEREGDELFGIHELRGKEAIELAKRLPRTSVWIDRQVKDGSRNNYGEAIIHNSISQRPVVGGMHDPFVPVPESRGSGRAPVLAFSAAIPDKGDEHMDPEKLKALAKALGRDELTEDDLLTAVTDHLSATTKEHEGVQAKLNEALAEIESLKKATADKDASSTGEPKELDPDVAELVADSVESMAASCVEAGLLCPDSKKQLMEVLVGQEGSRHAFALSHRGKGQKPLAMQIFKILRDNKPVPMGERTGPQGGRAFSTTKPGGDPNADKDLQAAQDRIVGNANGTGGDKFEM